MVKNNRGILAAVVVVGVLATGCGSDGGGAKGGLPKAEKLAADTGVRYGAVRVPALDGMTCDKGDGHFRFGSDLDMMVAGDDDLQKMTTCFWAHHGAIGVVDLFPPDGKHVPVDEAAAKTHEFAVGALSTAGAS
nr:hypothetical protein KitaXyl93_13010 [Kitasatospora sp. Xyl93]